MIRKDRKIRKEKLRGHDPEEFSDSDPSMCSSPMSRRISSINSGLKVSPPKNDYF
jgi:hypothetical protein